MRIASDTGGTFTDVVAWDGPGTEPRTRKVPSTPDDPARAVGEGLAEAGAEGAEGEHRHGSTVATNALLERKGARVVLVTNAGFTDVVAIARQARTDLYALRPSRPAPVVPAERRVGVDQRQGPSGEEERGLDADEVRAVVERVRDLEPEAVAVGLLHAYAEPGPEEALASAIEEGLDGVPVTGSADLCPEAREYERIETACVNAYLRPLMQRYLGGLAGEAGGLDLWVMQSNGGLARAEVAGAEPVHTLLSGPAGGVIGAARWAERVGFDGAITLDMGGTSTDVALVAGTIPRTHEGRVAGLPVAVPALEIHTIGAGGGSVAWLDEGGALRVGPRSAGAEPGPACYGRGGDEPTVTDALLHLGRIPARRFLGGEMTLSADRARSALRAVGERADLSPDEVALGVERVVEAAMEKALRVISTERGHDPADFCLVAFGGAGPLHAVSLARRLGIPTVVVPPAPGVLSAWGILSADVVRDRQETVLRDLTEVEDLPGRCGRLEEACRREVADQGIDPDEVEVETRLDLRYRGQSHELRVAFREGEDPRAAFDEAHERRYGYRDEARPVELVVIRGTARGPTERPRSGEPRVPEGDPRIGETRVVLGDGGGEPREAPVFDRSLLGPDASVEGPAVLAEYSATTFLPPGATARVAGGGALRVEVGA